MLFSCYLNKSQVVTEHHSGWYSLKRKLYTCTECTVHCTLYTCTVYIHWSINLIIYLFYLIYCLFLNSDANVAKLGTKKSDSMNQSTTAEPDHYI